MAKLDKFLLKEYNHPVLGKVSTLRKVPKSRTLIEVQIIDRGVGWNEMKKKYVGKKVASGWMRGQNNQYGHIDEVHYKELEELKED